MKLESNTTLSFLTYCAVETRLARILIGKCLQLFMELININMVLSGFSFNLFVNMKF